MTSSPKDESRETLLSLHPGIGLIRMLGQGDAWNCSNDRCSAIPGDDRGAVRFYDILIFPNQQVFSNGYHIDSTELRPTHGMTWKAFGVVPDFYLVTIRSQLCAWTEISGESSEVMATATTVSIQA